MKQSLMFCLVCLGFLFYLPGCQKIPSYKQMTLFAEDLKYPVCIRNAGDDRLFVLGQEGVIYILDTAGKVSGNLFLDIRDRVVYGGERGLLGIAFHPDFKENGYFYLNYVGKGDTTHISRFHLSGSDPDQADPGSEVQLLRIAQPYENHNGGELCFGPDGYLYIGMGDGGAAGDPGNRSQNPSVLLGKMLRIDVDHGSPYAIPLGNPFIDSSGYAPEIWATGLRNPWRFSFDRLNGDLWIADVGQDKIEEINYCPAGSKSGGNFGWRCFEGNNPYNQDSCGNAHSFIFPVHTYQHGTECSVTGGYVFRGDSTSPFYGNYFFADYCSDKIWTLHNVKGAWQVKEFGAFPGNNFCSFGEDSKGRLYIASITKGAVFRLNLSGLSNQKQE